MLKTSFINVIKTFSKDEFKRFIDFTDSPFHNSNKSIIKLVEAIKKYYPEFDNRNFTKEKIYKKIYPTGSYNDQVMRNLMSDALQLTFGFLSVKNLQEDKIQISVNLLKELHTKKLDTLHDKILKTARKYIDEDRSVNLDYFERQYTIEGIIFQSQLSHNVEGKIYPVVIRQSEYITYDYLTKLINHLIDMSINEKYFHVQDPSRFALNVFKAMNVEKILERLKTRSEKDHKILSIFYYRAMTILEGKAEYYKKFKELFFDNDLLFDRNASNNLITSLETYCISNIRNDPGTYRKELYEIHLKLVELNFVKMDEDYYLTILRFWNIFVNAVETGELGWAESFMNQYYKELEPAVKTSAYNFAQSILLYKKKNYGESLEKLNKVKLSPYLFKMQIKTLYLRIYFESGDFESASFAMDSYKQFLYKTKKINDTFREGHLNFLAVYYDLLKLKSGEKGIGKTDISHKIESIENVYNKVWLREALGGIK